MRWRWVAERVAFGGLPFVVALTTVVVSVREHVFAVDFDSVSPEIRSLVHGTDPYVTAHLAAGGHFLWPVLTGLLLLPVAWLPSPGGDVIATAAQFACLIGALRLLRVRDWRVYGITLAWPATVNSIESANLTLPICFLLALAWRERDRDRTGLWVGLAVAVKSLGWTLLVWLAATRRWRAFALALSVQVVGIVVVLPYLSLGAYVAFERTVERVFGPMSLTSTALLRDAGISGGAALALTSAAGLVVLAAGRKDFGLCVVAALLLSPVVWLHYYDLLLVPLAVWRARLWVWTIPLLLVITPGHGNGTTWQTAATLAVAAFTVFAGRHSSRTEVDVPARLRPVHAHG